MTHFLISPNDANIIDSFDTIKDIIKDDLEKIFSSTIDNELKL